MNDNQFTALWGALDKIAADQKKILDGQSAIMSMLRSQPSGKPGSEDEPVAEDNDLDGDYGNPEIRFDPKPKYWNGASFAGKRFSECTAEYLDAMAKYLKACAWGARKDGDDKKAGYKEKDAARARGWARRIRNGYKPRSAAPQAPPAAFGGNQGGYGSSGYGASQGTGYGGAPGYGAGGGYGAAPGGYGSRSGGYTDEHVIADHTGSFEPSDDDVPFVSCESRPMKV